MTKSSRTRAASRMLASYLYPYDNDAPTLIETWLRGLEREKSITRYEVDGSAYLQINNWLKHQKIDKPSKWRFPAFDDPSARLLEHSAKPREATAAPLAVPPLATASTGMAGGNDDPPSGDPQVTEPEQFGDNSPKPREASAPDIGPRTRDQGSGIEDQGRFRASPCAAQAPPPPQPATMRQRLWREAIPIIRRLTGQPDDKARGLLGRLLKAKQDDCARVYRVLRQAEDLNPADPVAWLRAACNDTSRHKKPNRVADALADIFGTTPPPTTNRSSTSSPECGEPTNEQPARTPSRPGDAVTPRVGRAPLRPVGWSRKCAANVKIRSTSLWHLESVPAIVKSASVSEAIHERA